MKVILAKTAGFCFGVNRAVETVYNQLNNGVSLCTLGPIIHNPYVITDLEKRGVNIIQKPEEAEQGKTVVIRAHGVTCDTYKKLEENKIPYIDCSCPFVLKIHRLVEKHSTPDNVLLIAGDENHPEVIGFRSRAKGESYVISNEIEAENTIKENCLSDKDIILVAQTTFSIEIFEKIKKNLKNILKNISIYDTICNATYERQNEAEELSKSCDAMIVIGGRFSSNTVKLQKVCAKHCETFLAEQWFELEGTDFSRFETIGITAGASTPAELFKEVIEHMTDNIENFEQLLEESLKDFSTDPKVEGTVTQVTPNEIQVDIGRKFTGYVPREEYSWDPIADHTAEVKVGDKIWVKIMKTSEDEGTIMCSKRRYDSDMSFDKIKAAHENDEVVTAVVSEIKPNGGVLVYPFGGRVFIPRSLLDLQRGESMEDLYGKEVSFKLISVDDDKRRAVGSIKAVTGAEREAAAAAFYATAELGKAYTGKVTSVVPYGAFIDLGGVEALLHKTEISWKRVYDVSTVLNIGDEVDVKIIEIKEDDKGRKRVSVSMKNEEDRPWPTFLRNCNVGDVVAVKVKEILSFGVRALLVDHHVSGLIHIREIANHYVENIENELKIDQVVDAKIVAIDTDKHRISLSIRELLEPEAEDEDEEVVESEEAEDAE